MKNFPLETHPYLLATGLMAVFFIAALVRVWLLRRQEEKLLKKIDSHEKQILTLQKDHMQTRQDANQWRAEMQRQFDLFRSTASQQLEVEQKRFDDLLSKSRDREHRLQTELDIAKQMCSELPATKARLMQMESMIGLDAGEGLVSEVPTVIAPPKLGLTTLPDLNGTAPEPLPEMPVEESLTAPAETEDLPEAKSDEMQTQLRHLQQQNQQLQQALTASRLRSRLRPRNQARGRNGKN